MFRYAPAILERFPATRAGAVRVSGIDGRDPIDGLTTAFLAEQAAVRDRLAAASPADLPSLAAWRRTFSAFGVSPTKHRSAPEALLRRLTKSGDIPAINPLVDIGNLVSIRYALPVIVVDCARIAGTITVLEATGEERFEDLGGPGSERPEPGEVIFVDEGGQVVARRWCWRQGAGTAAGPATADALYVIEAQHADGETDIGSAVATLTGLLARFFPAARVATGFLGPGAPRFDAPAG